MTAFRFDERIPERTRQDIQDAVEQWLEREEQSAGFTLNHVGAFDLTRTPWPAEEGVETVVSAEREIDVSKLIRYATLMLRQDEEKQKRAEKSARILRKLARENE